MGNDGYDDGKDDRPATLLIAAVPIGRPEDASPRLAAALSEAGIIAAEDTRRVRRLAAALGAALTARIVSYYDEVETRRAAGLLAELRAGHDVLLVSDAGMPGVSDPGYRIVAAAAAEGIRVTRAARAVRGDRRARDLRAAHRPVLLRGLPAAEGGRAGTEIR